MNKAILFEHEVWKDISGFESVYQISNYGNIRKTSSGQLLKQHANSRGYYLVWLHLEAERYHYSVHRLVAWHFLPPALNEQEVHHKDTNKHNNFYKNLEWIYHSENMAHAANDDNNRMKGEKHWLSKKIVHTPTGRVYGSISEAAKEMNCSMVNISMQIRGMRKNTLGFALHEE